VAIHVWNSDIHAGGGQSIARFGAARGSGPLASARSLIRLPKLEWSANAAMVREKPRPRGRSQLVPRCDAKGQPAFSHAACAA